MKSKKVVITDADCERFQRLIESSKGFRRRDAEHLVLEIEVVAGFTSSAERNVSRLRNLALCNSGGGVQIQFE